MIKFSTVQSFLSIKNVTIICNCTIEKILHNGKIATHLQTSKAELLPLRESKLVLAMSTLPNTTLVLNSFDPNQFPQLANVGNRFTAHFVSSMVSRVPRRNLLKTNEADDIELGALYITGMEKQAQYHIQLSAIAYSQTAKADDIYHVLKKFSANSIPEDCIDTANDFLVVSCSTLGELDYKNSNNRFYLVHNHNSLLDNGELNVILNDQDKQLWNRMDHVTNEILQRLSSPSGNVNDLEYWYEQEQTWRKEAPSSKYVRKQLLVHDASTMWIGDNSDLAAPVGLDYCLRGVNNVFITGGALWPTGGSWNPVLTITAMSMHLADILSSIR